MTWYFGEFPSALRCSICRRTDGQQVDGRWLEGTWVVLEPLSNLPLTLCPTCEKLPDPHKAAAEAAKRRLEAKLGLQQWGQAKGGPEERS